MPLKKKELDDDISDIELHRKLIQYGFPNTPVTETTRKILLKRLRNRMSKEKPFQRQDASSYRNVSVPNPSSRSTIHNNSLNKSYAANGLYYIDANRYSTNNRSNSDCEIVQLPYKQPMASPNIYAPPPILASDSDEDSGQCNYIRNAKPKKRPSNLTGFERASINSQMGVVNRLLSFRNEAMCKRYPCPTPRSYQSSEDLLYNHNRSAESNAKQPYKMFSQILKHLTFKPGLKQIFIPQVLVAIFIIFFAMLTFMYMLISPDFPNNIRESNTIAVMCNNADNALQAGNNNFCITRNKLLNTISVNKELVHMLLNRAEHHHCVDKNSQATVSSTDLLTHLNKNKINYDDDFNGTLENILHLVEKNPQWRITTMNATGSSIASPVEARQLSDILFILEKPKLPVSCILYNKLQQFLVIIGTIGLLAAVIFLVFFIVARIKARQYKRMATIENLSKAIVNELMSEAALKSTEDSSVIVTHLRDKLIPLNSRTTLINEWNETLRLLEANESRIQFGYTTFKGEEMRTMKWIGSFFRATGERQMKKQWQSPAFDNRNQIINPPTECLKIRHMFDNTEVNNPNLYKIICEALIEKVGLKCSIRDIQLDKESCCVYIRCAKNEDAGVVHNEINGWWFDNKLVSIKFLRLERYLSRFPNSSTDFCASSFYDNKHFS